MDVFLVVKLKETPEKVIQKHVREVKGRFHWSLTRLFKLRN